MKPGSNKINQEACAWIARLHDSELSPAELAELREWMEQSAAHRAEIRLMAKVWGDLDVLTELAVPVEMPRLRGIRLRPFLTPLFDRPVTAGAIASTAALLLTLLIWQPFQSSSDEAPLSGAFSTAIGEQNLVVLPDGSTALLNTNTQIVTDYSEELRSIRLTRGEAHFDVAKDPDRPFQVFAGTGVVRAIGTAFSVRLKQHVVDVTVVKGSVQIAPMKASSGVGEFAPVGVKKTPIIKSGQSALFDQITGTIELVETISQIELSHKLAWREGLLQFSGDPLGQVVDEIARYTPLTIVIKDPELRDLRIGGLFQVGETGKMFGALERSFGVRVEYAENDVVYLSMAARSNQH